MSKKDMRRADLGMQSAAFGGESHARELDSILTRPIVVPYVEPKKDEKSADLGSK